MASNGPTPTLIAGGLAQAPSLIEGDDSDDVEIRAAEALSQRSTDGRANLPPNELTRDLLYKFLLAEIAGQRGNVRLASKAYMEIAQVTRDPRVARRATEIAMYGRYNDVALDAASLWVEVEPDSSAARQALVSVLVNNNKLSDAKPYLQKLLAADKSAIGPSFLQLNPLLGRHPDKNAVYLLIRDLAAPYPEVPEAHFSVAQAALVAGKTDAAGQAARQALKLRPDWEPAALVNAQALQRESNAKALEFLQGFLAANPGARDARLSYARMLVAEKRIDQARREFQRIEQEAPNNADVAVTIGLLSLQMNDYDLAEAKFKRALELNYRDADALRYYLGQVAEERKRYDEALGWYGKVMAGEQVVPAAARYAFILAKQNKVAEARTYLQGVEVQNPQQRTQLTQAEAQVLREAKAYQESFDLLGNALDQQPDHPDLLYDYAMAAERLDRIDVLEAKLKRLIQLKPDHAQAYNALGYTLADRNIRLKEAREFIEKALKLSPDDPFILDSMGWVAYRMGSLNEGLDYLKRAYSQRPDPEIAAHLGEVLWVQGKKSEAEQLWRSSMKDHPGNDELKAVMKKFLN
ncbi:MAG: tetratricopeptide repeat protein [Burkholderiales bacterium]|nr:tetratricopeptide repeat protein [Burkholderiales bacterium]